MALRSSGRAAWLTARIFLPSGASLAACVAIGTVAMLSHLLIIGVDQGSVLPDFLDGQWTEAYTNVIKVPLDTFLGGSSLNSGLEVVLWGLIGLVVYTIAERTFTNMREWREAEHAVQMVDAQHLVQHPLQRPFYQVLMYRIAVGGLFAVWAVILIGMLRQLIQVNDLPFVGVETEQVTHYLFLFFVQWTVMAHAFVVLLRLSARRARLMKRHSAYGDNDSFFQD